MTAKDRQVGGDHYSKLGAYQPWEVLKHWLTKEEMRGFLKGTIICYLARERDKGGDQDVFKALHTGEFLGEILREIERESRNGNFQNQSRPGDAERHEG